jgi:hypothetical protein
MIWIGRLFSLVLGVVLFALLLVTLVLLRVSDTFLDPGFYPRELENADIYEFVLVDLLSTALDEARELPPEKFSDEIDENPLETSGLSSERIVEAINRAVPPEYVQGLVEQSFDQFGRYLTGERDEFTFTLMAGDQVAIMVDEVKALLREADAYELLFSQGVEPAIRDAVTLELPLGVDVSSGRLVESVRAIVPPDWVRDQVEGTLDEATPYFLGEKDRFEIRVQLSDRVEVALEEVKSILREVDAFELLYTEVVEPAVLTNLDASVDLPFGVEVTQEEILSALREVAPPEWVQEQVEILIDDASPYLTGKEDRFSTEISLVENKRLAGEVIAELVNSRLDAVIESLPKCQTRAEIAAALQGATGGLPSCVPSELSVSQLIDRSGIDVAGTVQKAVLGSIPNRIRFTDSQVLSALKQAGAGDNADLVDDVREILRDGWVYTDEDMKTDLAELDDEAVENLESIRAFLADGWTYTDIDFKEHLAKYDPIPLSGEDLFFVPDTPLEQLNIVRKWLDWARTFRWVIYVPMILLLVVVGFLGGRGWSGRVIWASSFLLVSAGIIVVIAGPVYSSLSSSGFDQAREEALKEIDKEADQDFLNTSRLVANKSIDVGESIANDFVSGIRNSAVNLALISLVAILIAVFWNAITDVIIRYWPEKDEEPDPTAEIA